jgi:leucine dehydrogenase
MHKLSNCRTGFSGAKLVVKSDHEDLSVIQRKGLMEDVAKALDLLDGSMYTGCDLNTCDIDMDYLTEATGEKYVLAGRNSRVDTNIATASSVIGSILGTVKAMEGSREISNLTFTVQGCGKVGSTVAKELVRNVSKHAICSPRHRLFLDVLRLLAVRIGHRLHVTFWCPALIH